VSGFVAAADLKFKCNKSDWLPTGKVKEIKMEDPRCDVKFPVASLKTSSDKIYNWRNSNGITQRGQKSEPEEERSARKRESERTTGGRFRIAASRGGISMISFSGFSYYNY
jgi:hypothetical protein